jgi:hypothetical protein
MTQGNARITVNIGTLLALGQHGIGLVPVTQINVRIGNRLIHAACSKERRNTHDVARVRLLECKCGDGSTFGVIACEKTAFFLTIQNGREFPGEVMGIMDSRVPAVATVRRHLMGGITKMKNSLSRKFIGNLRGRVPLHNVVNLHGKVGHSEARATEFNTHLIRKASPDIAVRRCGSPSPRRGKKPDLYGFSMRKNP